MDELGREILKDIALEEIAPRAQKRSPADHWSSAILLERAAYLKKMARYGDGSASEVLRDYPGHAALLSFRSRDSDAEMHEGHAFFICVLAGTATLVMGGTLVRPKRFAPGEMHGNGIDGGVRQELKAGEIVHVPTGVPYQLLVAGEKTITCFVMKIQETE